MKLNVMEFINVKMINKNMIFRCNAIERYKLPQSNNDKYDIKFILEYIYTIVNV